MKIKPDHDNGGCAVKADRLTVVRCRVSVLSNVDLAVRAGETVALMGPNGAGKTTLLKCLAGAIRPTSGNVHWVYNSIALPQPLHQQIGFVGHECGLYTELTALENLLFAGRMYRVRHAGGRAWELLAAAGLKVIAHRPVAQLSRGTRQRLAIVRSVVHEPQLILLDEPFASLDADARQWLEELFEQWRRTGRTVCFASHDAHQSRTLAERIVWLDAGRTVESEPKNGLSTRLLRSA